MSPPVSPGRIRLVGTLALVALLWSGYTTYQMHFGSIPGTLSVANVEAKSNEWLLKYGIGMQKLPEDANTYFTYKLTMKSGRPLLLFRPKTFDNYLYASGTVNLSPGHRQLLSDMSPDKRAVAVEELKLEIARFKIGYQIDMTQLTPVTMIKRMPITNELTEMAFLECLDEIDEATDLVVTKINLSLGIR